MNDDRYEGRRDKQIAGLTCTVNIHRAYTDNNHPNASDPCMISACGYSIFGTVSESIAGY